MSISLSPLPESVTTIDSVLFIFFEIFIACAIACADSNAGIIPSVRVKIKNASITSSSVTALYSTLFSSFRYACSGPTPG